MQIDFKRSRPQLEFFSANADEVLFGGAAGGGKSYAQLIDSFVMAMKYPGIKQLILRRTFPELEKSLIRVHLGMFPRTVYRYNRSSHTGTFYNGSIIDFGYCDNEKDVYKYQSAEYDVIRFDELTHFTEEMYVYLISRLRGVSGYPKQMKSSTNPGGVGHFWVKERFIDTVPPKEVYTSAAGTTRVFIPSKVTDNVALMEKDPDYIKRLENLSEKDRKALLYGDWDITDGVYFSEFKRDIHVVKPFAVPEYWRKYVSFDYGLDMLAAYVIAVDEGGKAWVIREEYTSNLIISQAAARIKRLVGADKITAYFAPPDLWNRRQDSGRSVAEIFAEHGIYLVKAANDRVQGWYGVKEYLHPYTDETGTVTANMQIFDICTNLIRTLPSLQTDKHNPNDVADEPHEYTHAPDAIRYFVAGRPMRGEIPQARDEDVVDYDDQIDNFIDF